MFARLMLLWLVAGTVALCLTEPVLAGTEFEGSVVFAGDRQLVLSVNREQQIFVVNDDTNITVDDNEAMLADIPIGHRATVSAEQQGDRWVATRIAAVAIK